jgi:glycosyltransferase involved in cell wall biosynthesis
MSYLPGEIREKMSIYGGSGLPDLFSGARIIRNRLSMGAGEGKSAQLYRLWWQRWGMPLEERRKRVDIWYSPTHHGRIGPGVPQIITIHDLIALRFPEQNPIQTAYYRFLLPTVLDSTELVIVNSEATRDDLIERYCLDPKRVKVIHLGYEPVRSERDNCQSGQLDNVILVPGAGYPHKNADRVMRAFSMLPRDMNYRLVVTGAGRYTKALKQKASRYHIDDLCDVYSYLSEAEMSSIWARTKLVVYASLWEGFGIPPLEAMDRGIPCVVSDIPAVREVCGDAAIYANPYDVDDICSRILGVLRGEVDLQFYYIKGKQRISRFSWEKAATELSKILASFI